MRRAMQTVGWGLYLASSWTWCIGMFLPILLLRWWGWPGFLAFAVPNVLGCSLFGYVLTPASAAAFRRRFGIWILIFAAATIAFQAGFLLRAGPVAALVAALPLVIVLLVFPWRPTRRLDLAIMGAGTAAWLTSIVLFARLGEGTLPGLSWSGSLPPMSLAWAAPFMSFGFLLCPYLDPTFHLALQRSPSRHSFAVFGVGFAVMLLFTAAFSEAGLDPALSPAEVLAGRPVFQWQWGLQAAFTMVAVAHATRHLEPVAWLGGSRPLVTGLVLAACLALAWSYLCESWMPAMATSLAPASGNVPGEATYLRWLGLYGVLFPGMLLLGLRRTPVPVMVLALTGAGLLAENGMLGGQFPLLAGSVGLLLLAAMWPTSRMRATAEMPPPDPR